MTKQKCFAMIGYNGMEYHCLTCCPDDNVSICHDCFNPLEHRVFFSAILDSLLFIGPQILHWEMQVPHDVSVPKIQGNHKTSVSNP